LAELDAGRRPNLLQTIADGVADAVMSLDVEPDASAAYHYETELATIGYEDFRFLGDDGEYELGIVQIGKDKIVVEVGISVKASASADFDFSVWDSKEYAPMGSSSAETEAEFEAAPLLTFEGDFAATAPESQGLQPSA
jgi:hypothetical protein